MLECGVVQETARVLSQFKGAKPRVGVKPLLSFSGTQFEDPSEGGKFALAKSMFLDFFRGGETKEIDVEGLQWMINLSAGEEEDGLGGKREMVYMRCWRLVTKRSGQKLPRVEVEEMGPRVDFRLGRVRDADGSVMKEAMKKAKGIEVSCDVLGFYCVSRMWMNMLLTTFLYSREQRKTWRQILWGIRLEGYI